MATETGVPYWGQFPEVWDTASIGGESIPGICRVSGDGLKIRSDQKRAAGMDGASVAMLGLDVASFTIEVKLWTEEHLRAFQAIIGLAKPKTIPRYKTTRGTSSSVTQVRYAVVNGEGGPQSVMYGGHRIATIQRKLVGYDLVPLDVSHPALSLFGITQCVVESISLPAEQSPGLWTATLRCREFRKPARRGVSRETSGQTKQVGDLDGIQTAIDAKPSQRNTSPGV